MKTLKIEHLSPYLPYNLRFKSYGKEWEMTELRTTGQYKVWACAYWCDKALAYIPDINARGNSIGTGFKFKDIKLILHPLSDLMKEIEHNGEKFIPSKRIFEEGYGSYTLSYAKDHIEGISFGFMQRLIEWHFDVFGLIEQGLAIEK